MITQIRKRSQITIPREVVKELGLKQDDYIEVTIEDNKIILTPVVVVDKDQAWFWSEEWQKKERKVDEDIKAGGYKDFDNIYDLIKDLDNDEI